MRRTCLEVSRKLFRENVKNIKEKVHGAEIMPVVKANAYGTYLNKDIKLMNEFETTNKDWLEDFAMFMTLKEYNEGKSFLEWEECYKLREKNAVTRK